MKEEKGKRSVFVEIRLGQEKEDDKEKYGDDEYEADQTKEEKRREEKK